MVDPESFFIFMCILTLIFRGEQLEQAHPAIDNQNEQDQRMLEINNPEQQ